MLQRKPLAEKILLLGVDGLDPRLTKKYLEEGKLPNIQKYIDRGACREDLVMLGGHPTVTPPMWTTLATGCYSNVHGITDFYRKSDTGTLDMIEYNCDSRFCKAEQLWNVFAEAGKKTLVFHWPGAAWPPSSDSENLFVVDGTAPGGVARSVASVDPEFIVGASETFKEVTFKSKGATEGIAPCVIDDLEVAPTKEYKAMTTGGGAVMHRLLMRDGQMTSNMTDAPIDLVQSPIKPATGWADAPADAKEFTLLLSGGLIRRPGLILKGETGVYDKVILYKNKKDMQVVAEFTPGVINRDVMDEAIKNDVRYTQVNRDMKVLELDPEGKTMKMWVSPGMDITNDSVYSPKRLHDEILDNVGCPPPTSLLGCQDPQLITDCMLDCWYHMADWQADAMLHLIESEKLDVVFSHFHAIDLQAHMVIKYLSPKDNRKLPEEAYYKFMEDIYLQTDYYLGKFLHLLDEDWSIMIFSDHGQVSATHDIPILADVSGCNVKVMQELGFTVLKKDENGNVIEEIDWTKTKAVAQREGHVYINLKGRDKTGIVDPEDQYELEEEIMTALYGYKDPKTGHRVVSVALRNRDAVLLGQGGPDAGDICFWLAEGYNFDHGDCLSTTWGAGNTSVSPIFIASGKGVKQGFYTDRIIRQIDFVPTVAVIGGVRMPAQCEGAPVYQILENEY